MRCTCLLCTKGSFGFGGQRCKPGRLGTTRLLCRFGLPGHALRLGKPGFFGLPALVCLARPHRRLGFLGAAQRLCRLSVPGLAFNRRTALFFDALCLARFFDDSGQFSLLYFKGGLGSGASGIVHLTARFFLGGSPDRGLTFGARRVDRRRMRGRQQGDLGRVSHWWIDFSRPGDWPTAAATTTTTAFRCRVIESAQASPCQPSVHACRELSQEALKVFRVSGGLDVLPIQKLHLLSQRRGRCTTRSRTARRSSAGAR